MVMLETLRTHEKLREEVWRGPVSPSDIGPKMTGLAKPHHLNMTPFSPGAFHVKAKATYSSELRQELDDLKRQETISHIGKI